MRSESVSLSVEVEERRQRQSSRLKSDFGAEVKGKSRQAMGGKWRAGLVRSWSWSWYWSQDQYQDPVML